MFLYRSIIEEGTANQSTTNSSSVPSIELSAVATPDADEDQKDAPISEDDSWIVHIENEEVAGEFTLNSSIKILFQYYCYHHFKICLSSKECFEF